jgi:hypothetical protein
VHVDGAASANLVACAVAGDKGFNSIWVNGVTISGQGGQPRLERCTLAGIRKGIIITEGAQPTIEGGSFQLDGPAIEVRQSADPEVTGCAIRSANNFATDMGLIDVAGARGTYTANFVEDHRASAHGAMYVAGGSHVRVANNLFRNRNKLLPRFEVENGAIVQRGFRPGIAILLEGAETQATLGGNQWDGCVVASQDGARYEVSRPNLETDSR